MNAFVPSSDGICTSLGKTLGTWTVAKTVSLLFSLFASRAAILRVLFLIKGNGLEASTAIGVKTG